MVYQVLNKSTSEIRLLKIERQDQFWDGEQLLSCTLLPIAIFDGQGLLPLEKQHECLTIDGREPFKLRYDWGDYTALSYCWGTGEDHKQILLNGSPRRVTTNLWWALRDIRQHLGNAVDRLMLWVDALCINQDNNEERNHQVRLMRNIYIGSRLVIAWLGRPENDSDLAFDHINDLAKRYPNMDDLVSACYQRVPIFTARFIRAFLFLATRQYWTRLWIIQEIALGDVLLLCGEKSTFWERLISVEQCIGGMFHVSEVFSAECLSALKDSKLDFSSLNCFRQLDSCRWYMERDGEMDIVWLMRLGMLASVTDQRDRVYGLLGLMRPNIASNIIPDYNIGPQETYATFTKSLIHNDLSLEVLRLAGETRTCYSQKSWIPTFAIQPWANPLYPPESKQQASKNIPIDVDLERSEGGIGCRGIAFDFVDGVSVTHPEERSSWQRTYALEHVPIQPRSPFARRIPLEEAEIAIWKTLTANRDVSGNVTPTEYSNLLQIDIESKNTSSLYLSRYINENREFMVFGRKFGDYFSFESKRKDPHLYEAAYRAQNCLTSRKLVTTRKGFLALVPGNTQKGDIVSILFGCSTPLLLRRVGCHYQLIGESYVHDIMDGEAVEAFWQNGSGSEMFVLH